MKQKIKTVLISLTIIGMTACASQHSAQSDPTYRSQNHYQDYNCKQITAEKKRINTKLEQISEISGTNATGQVLGTALAGFCRISRL